MLFRSKKDNRPKMCFKVIGPRIIIWRILLLTFVLLSSCSIFGAPFSTGIHSLPFFFFFLLLFFLACAFFVYAHFRFQQGEFGTFFFEHQNLIVHDFDRTFLVLAFSMKGDPWSGLMKEIIRLKRGQLVDNFRLVKG